MKKGKISVFLRNLAGWTGTAFMVLPPGVPLLLLILLTSRDTYTNLYFPQNAKIINSLIASLAVSLPIVFKCFARSMRDLDPEMLGIAGTLGMSRGMIFRRIVLPQCRFAVLAGILIMAGRFFGEFLSDGILLRAIEGRDGTALKIFSEGITGQVFLHILFVSAVSIGAGLTAAGICLLIRSMRRARKVKTGSGKTRNGSTDPQKTE